MLPRAGLVLLLLSLFACTPSEESHSKAIIGATLIDGRGGPPVSDSVVLVGQGRILEVGARSTVPISAEAAKIDGSGKFLMPAPVDICDRADPPGLIRPADPEAARSQVATLAAGKATAIHLAETGKAIVEAALAAARDAGIPVTGHISTQAGARLLVDNGASVLVGMIRDTENLDSVFVNRLRDLRIVVAPALSNSGSGLDIAKRNTHRLFAGGVLLGLASEGADPVREAELMEQAGVPPLDVIVAATKNGAMALHQLDQRGTVEAGKIADLLLLSANPGEDVRNLRMVTLKWTGAP